MANDYDNHERIWLEPVKPVDPIDGRQWCRDNVWGNGVEYVRADLASHPVQDNACPSCGGSGRYGDAAIRAFDEAATPPQEHVTLLWLARPSH